MNKSTAMFGAGCFWGVEERFRKLKGVEKTMVGYSGGDFANPTYKDVCSGKTGHAEVVKIEFDPEIITYDELLDVFWKIHNPTSLNRQGFDIGAQYRSVIFYYTPEQKEKAIQSKRELEESGKYDKPIVTQIEPAKEFYRAEEYHQKYVQKRSKRSIFH
jgi:peptide-methionine (S)-S-oxide reductase